MVPQITEIKKGEAESQVWSDERLLKRYKRGYLRPDDIIYSCQPDNRGRKSTV